jgi:lipid-binding SYLF domain-containing protein
VIGLIAQSSSIHPTVGCLKLNMQSSASFCHGTRGKRNVITSEISERRRALGGLHAGLAGGGPGTIQPAAKLMREAKAVFIVPKLIKGGFIVGGEGGNGVLMAHHHTGWSAPAFYAIGAGSFGLQAGLEQSEMIMLIMTQKGLDGVMHDNFKIGAQAGISVVTLGSGVEGAIGGASLPDVVVWSSSTGLYGGLTVDGSVIRSEPNMDTEFYGRPVTAHDVLFGSVVSPHAADLRRELDRLG